MGGECSSVLQVQVPAGAISEARSPRGTPTPAPPDPGPAAAAGRVVPGRCAGAPRAPGRSPPAAMRAVPGRAASPRAPARPRGVQARQPGRQIEQRRPDTGPVPIDEDGSLAYQAEVVAADVAVQERAALQHRLAGGLRQGVSPCLEPGGIEHPERECALGVCAKRQPSLLDVEHLAEEGLDLLGRRRRLHRRQRVKHGVDPCGRPGRRPVGAREVLEHEGRGLSVVVPPQQSGQVIVSGEDLVVRSLEPEPVGRVVERGDLCEGGRPVVEGHEPAAVGRCTVPGGRDQGGRPLPAGGLDTTSIVLLFHSRHLRTRARASLGR